MYAVIENGGKQYRVELGAELELDQMSVDPGQTIDIGRVLLVADGDEAHVGTPVVEGARVTGEVVGPMRGEKLVVFKYRPKARRRVKHGHRQDLTLVRVADIEFGGRSAAKEAKVEADKAAAQRAEADKAAASKAQADKALADKLAREKAADARETKASAKPAKSSSTAKTAAAAKSAAADKKPTTTKASAKPAPAPKPKSAPAKSTDSSKSRTRTKKEE